MVVEDEWLIRTVVVEVLADAGFEVIEAERGDVALETLEQDKSAVDILFTDIRMPGSIDGLQLARRVAALKPDMAIVVASGNYMPSKRDLPSGCLFMSKPYSLTELPTKLSDFLRTFRST